MVLEVYVGKKKLFLFRKYIFKQNKSVFMNVYFSSDFEVEKEVLFKW